MTDDPIRSAFDLLERTSAAPSRAFADDLFTRLVEEAGRRPALVPPPSVRRRRPALRRALTIAAALGLVVLVFAVAVVPLRNLVGRRSEPAIEPGGSFHAAIQGSFQNPGNVLGPAFTESPGGTFRLQVDYAAPDSWRIDVAPGSVADLPLVNANIGNAGGYAIWDGRKLHVFDASSNTTSVYLHAPSYSPLNLLEFDDPAAPWKATCASSPSPVSETLLGRPVDHYTCPASGTLGDHVDLWVDVESRLVLQIESHLPSVVGTPTPLSGPLTFVPGESLRFTSIEYDPRFAADAFVFSTPSGSSPQPPLALPTSLTPGGTPPDWSGNLLDGSFDLASTRGKPTAVYFWADWCAPCVGAPLDALQQAFTTRSNELSIVTIATSIDPATVERFVASHGYDFPVIEDAANTIGPTWGLTYTPVLVLLDAKGRFVGAYGGFNAEIGTKADITDVLDALVSGRALPHDRVFSSEQLG